MVISGPATILEDLGLYLSNRVTVTDCGEGRHPHDCSLATARTTPPRCQRGSRLGAVATCIGMLHWWHSPSNLGSAKISHPDFWGSASYSRIRVTWRALGLSAPFQLRLLAGPEHGRTIPLADVSRSGIPQCSGLPEPCVCYRLDGRQEGSPAAQLKIQNNSGLPQGLAGHSAAG
jgi:hypothetical protein